MLNATSLRWLLAALIGWLDQRQQQAMAYLIEENRILRGHVRGRIRLTDEERRRLARHGHRARLGEAGIRMVQTPYQAPNANAYAERFVRSIKEECLDRVIPFGDGHLRRTIAEYVEPITESEVTRGSRTR